MNPLATTAKLFDGSHRTLSMREPAIRQPCVLLPVLDNALPLIHLQLEGQLQSVDPHQIVVDCLSTKSFSSGSSLAVGIVGPDDTVNFAAIVVDHVGQLDGDHVAVQGHIGGVLQDLLEHDLIEPSLNPTHLRFEHAISERILGRLADARVMDRIVVDRIQMCPHCGGLPVCRYTCRACRSPLVATDELVHHFACAHVAAVDQFRHGQQMRCPKCQMGPLIVGADFDYFPGMHTCLACSNISSHLDLSAQCLLCQHRFAIDEATTQDLFGYRPNRLDLAMFFGKRVRD